MAIVLAVIFASVLGAGSRVAPSADLASSGSLRTRSLPVEAVPPSDALLVAGHERLEDSKPPSRRTRELESKRAKAKAEAEGAPKSVIQFLLIMPDRYNHIAYDVEYNTLMEQIITLPMRRPRAVNLVMATVKTWLADMIVQITEVRGKPGMRIDWNRSAAFAAFGLLYIGVVQWALYVSVMTNLCPNAITFSNEPLEAKLLNGPGKIDLVKQVLIDNFIFEVLIYFPVFYIIKELVTSSSKEPVVDALRKYRSNFVSDNLASMVFWIPGDFVAFAAPIFLRLPIDHTVSFVWTMVLSYRRGGSNNNCNSNNKALV